MYAHQLFSSSYLRWGPEASPSPKELEECDLRGLAEGKAIGCSTTILMFDGIHTDTALPGLHMNDERYVLDRL